MLKRKLLTVFLLIIFSLLLRAQSLRVEPMNWWTGMKNQDLQIMVYGEKIGETTPVINYSGVTIKKVNKADSKNYLFIDLYISKTAKPGKFPIVFKKVGKTEYTVDYILQSRKAGASQVKGFSSSDVIYLITPDRFANGDESNDVVIGMREKTVNRKNDYGRHGGDIRGMIDQIDYIANMGYTAIWPTPLLENDMPRSSYHGYAITGFYKVDPRFGTLEEYKELADKASRKGIKLIFDGVVNHSGSNYWWMHDLPFHNWLNYTDSIRITNHRHTTQEDPYVAAVDKDLMTKGWFVTTMPDLNQQNSFLATYLIQNSIWWIETLGLAGIRQDTYPYSPKKFLEQWTCSIMKEYPDFNMVGEEMITNPSIVAYWQQGKQNNGSYNGCLKTVMDFPLQAILMQSLTEEESWGKGLVRLYDGLANDFVYANPNNLLVFGDNHDMDRVFTQLKNDPALVQMAMSYLLTIRGIPQVYYGTEVLIDNTAKPGDDGLRRTDFPGGWKTDNVNGFTGVGLSNDQQQMQAFMKKLLNWRKNKSVIHNGNTLHFVPDNGTYVYFRYNKQDTVMIILNKNTTSTIINTGRFAEIIKNKKSGIDVLSGQQVSIAKEISVAPRSALILELK
jgi:glycosidase